MRPIVSDVEMATYNTAKNLANLPAPLGKSDFTVIKTADFINHLKKGKKTTKYEIIPFAVKSLFSNVPLDKYYIKKDL